MNIEKLIETAEKCGDRTTDCNKCEFQNKENCVDELNKELLNRLKIAIDDLSRQCSTCMYYEKTSREMPCAICYNKDKWIWKGKEL